MSTASSAPTDMPASRPETPLTVDQFWQTIEDAWATIPEAKNARNIISSPAAPADRRCDSAHRLQNLVPMLIKALKSALEVQSTTRIRSWDEIIKKLIGKLHRSDVWEQLGGSDDGFLYRRAFVIAVGRKYFELVDRSPEMSAGKGWGACDAELLLYVGMSLLNPRLSA